MSVVPQYSSVFENMCLLFGLLAPSVCIYVCIRSTAVVRALLPPFQIWLWCWFQLHTYSILTVFMYHKCSYTHTHKHMRACIDLHTHTHFSMQTQTHTVHLQNVNMHKATVYDMIQWPCNIKYIIACINFHTETLSTSTNTHTVQVHTHKAY